jgi:hypothetical protein
MEMVLDRFQIWKYQNTLQWLRFSAHKTTLDYPEPATFLSLIPKNCANWFGHALPCRIGKRKWGDRFRGLYKYTVLILAEKKKKLVVADVVDLHCLDSEGMTAGDCNSIFDPFPEAQHKCQFKGTTPARKHLY